MTRFRKLDHSKLSGRRLYELACQLYLEGIVGKRYSSPYEINNFSPHWIKIKSRYIQKEGREDTPTTWSEKLPAYSSEL